MQKIFLILLCGILLAGCERPATITSWSPINDAIPRTLDTSSTIEATSEVTLLPGLDLDLLPDALPDSMKGYELVSWQTGEEWNFTLVTGTNREKTFEELVDPESKVTEDGYVKITVTGLDQIKQVLQLLPAGSEVLWEGMDLSGMVPEGTLYFSYPPVTVMDDLIDFCAIHDITLANMVEPD